MLYRIAACVDPSKRYQKLTEYDRKVNIIYVKEQNVTFEKMQNKDLILYIHGKGGTAEEAEHYKPLFPQCDVVGLDYKSEAPWEAEAEFPRLLEQACQGYASVTLIANSIGAYFAMCARLDSRIERAYFISPVVDMERLIWGMMQAAGVTEQDLRTQGEIQAPFGETLSWAYLQYAKVHALGWGAPTAILYGENDALTDLEAMTVFAHRIHASLTVMPGGAHWFHTPEQMAFLDAWLRKESNNGA